MTALRDKIKKLIDSMPEESLTELMKYIEKNEKDKLKKSDSLLSNNNLDKILSEDAGLLDRLAQ